MADRRLDGLEWRADVVHVVGLRLDDAIDDAIDGAIDLLDAAERDRAARFVFERDRRRFIAAHAGTRIVLAACLRCAPESLRFAIGPFGKPRVVDPPQDVRFSLSHAGDHALLAVALEQEVGVDLEAHRAIDVMELAGRFFGPREIDAIAALPDAERPAAFFRCWTRKEAFIKALGQGLSFPLDGFEVSVEDEDAPQLLRACAAAPEALGRWRVVSLDAGPGYAAAVAAGPTAWHVRRWDVTIQP